jgi:hypothetical protein
MSPSHLSLKNDQPHVLIPENDYRLEEGPQDLVQLLRDHAAQPDVITFIADMLEI